MDCRLSSVLVMMILSSRKDMWIKLLFLSFFLLSPSVFASAKSFLMKENNQILMQEGNNQYRHAPCSTFKIAISLMGYNEGILQDENHPELPYKEGYVDWLEVWKHPHNPKTWMKNSCIWYSQIITQKLGMEKFQNYLKSFNYGNQDASGDKGKNNGLTNSWLSSSLEISAEEQIAFLQNLLNNQLPVSQKSHDITKNLLFLEVLDGDWKLYGKTGSGYQLNQDGSRNEDRQIGWFVGWITKGSRTIIFACYIEDKEKIEGSAGKRAKEEAKEKLKHWIEARLNDERTGLVIPAKPEGR